MSLKIEKENVHERAWWPDILIGMTPANLYVNYGDDASRMVHWTWLRDAPNVYFGDKGLVSIRKVLVECLNPTLMASLYPKQRIQPMHTCFTANNYGCINPWHQIPMPSSLDRQAMKIALDSGKDFRDIEFGWVDPLTKKILTRTVGEHADELFVRKILNTKESHKFLNGCHINTHSAEVMEWIGNPRVAVELQRMIDGLLDGTLDVLEVSYRQDEFMAKQSEARGRGLRLEGLLEEAGQLIDDDWRERNCRTRQRKLATPLPAVSPKATKPKAKRPRPLS